MVKSVLKTSSKRVLLVYFWYTFTPCAICTHTCVNTHLPLGGLAMKVHFHKYLTLLVTDSNTEEYGYLRKNIFYNCTAIKFKEMH